jgi:hypothetical protein
MKKIFALVLVLCMALCIFAGCKKNEPLTPEDAIRAIAADLNVDTGKIQGAHVHVAEGSTPAYSIYFSVDGVNYQYVVSAVDGTIISSTIAQEGHSH